MDKAGHAIAFTHTFTQHPAKERRRPYGVLNAGGGWKDNLYRISTITTGNDMAVEFVPGERYFSIMC